MKWTSRTQPIKVGDTVEYSRQFLQSIACYTSDMPDIPARVNVNNLCRVKRIAYGS